MPSWRPRPSETGAPRVARTDDGSAPLEFLSAGVLLLVPLVYLVLTLSALQSAAFATEGAAAAAVRVLSRSDPSAAEASERAEAAAGVALADFGIPLERAEFELRCAPVADCRETGGVLTVTVRTDVPLPLLPPWFGAALPLTVPVQSVVAQPVTRFPEPG